MRKPSINIKPVANNYAMPHERIVEINSGTPGGPGALVSLVAGEDGTLLVEIYRIDEGVTVRVSEDRE